MHTSVKLLSAIVGGKHHFLRVLLLLLTGAAACGVLVLFTGCQTHVRYEFYQPTGENLYTKGEEPYIYGPVKSYEKDTGYRESSLGTNPSLNLNAVGI